MAAAGGERRPGVDVSPKLGSRGGAGGGDTKRARPRRDARGAAPAPRQPGALAGPPPAVLHRERDLILLAENKERMGLLAPNARHLPACMEIREVGLGCSRLFFFFFYAPLPGCVRFFFFLLLFFNAFLGVNNIQKLQSQLVTVICLQAKGECRGLGQPRGPGGLALSKVQHTRSSAFFFPSLFFFAFPFPPATPPPCNTHHHHQGGKKRKLQGLGCNKQEDKNPIK